MKGRKPLPTKLKLLSGNPGKQKLPKGEPEPDSNIPAPPAVLNDYALEEKTAYPTAATSCAYSDKRGQIWKS